MHEVELNTGEKPLGILIPISDYATLWNELKTQLKEDPTDVIPDMMEMNGIRIHPWNNFHFEPILKFRFAINQLKTERGIYLQ